MSKTILLVEDNFDNRSIYEMILQHAGFRVANAGDGLEAVAKTRELLPDLVLMDISIPGIDGYEATRRIKADVATRHIPVVALTAHAMLRDREMAEEAGCDGYLAKPVEPRRVLEEVRRWLGEG